MARIRFRFPFFYTIFFLVLVGASYAVRHYLGVLKLVLADYEDSLFKYVAEDVFETYFKNPDFEFLLDTTEYAVSPAESKADLLRYVVDSIGDGEVTYKNVKTNLDGVKVYDVKKGSVKFAVFTLERLERRSEYGFELYGFGNVEFIYTPPPGLGVKVRVPERCTVYVNDLALGPEYVIQADIPSDIRVILPEGVRGIYYSIYEINGLIYEPTVFVFDEEGKENELRYDGSGRMYSADKITYSEEWKKRHEEYVIAAIQAYASFMTNDGPKAEAVKYFKRGTPLFTKLNGAETQWMMPHTGCYFTEVETGKFYAYDENTFSCTVGMKQVLVSGRNEEFEYVDVTIYLEKVDGVFLIYDMYNN